MKKISIILLGLLFSFAAIAQDVRFSQPYSAPLKVNPATMGAENSINGKLTYRSQWAGIDNGYTTAAVTVTAPIYKQGNGSKLDLGIYVMNDQAGAFNNLEAMLAIGYNLRINESGHFLSTAIYGGFNQNYLEIGNLTFDDQYQVGSYQAANPSSETVMNESVSYIDAGFGLMWFYQPTEPANINAFAGFSAYHVNQPNMSFTEEEGLLFTKFSTQAGVKVMPEGSKVSFIPNIIGTSQNGIYELASGLYIDYAINDDFITRIGTWYRANNTLAFMVGFEFAHIYLGYSYDLPNSGLSNMAIGANTHEISLSYYFNQSDDIRKLF